MIVIDSSAVVAILLGEPEAAVFNRVALDNRVFMSSVNVFETETVVLGRLGKAEVYRVRDWLNFQSCDIVSFSDTQSGLASEAYRRFGKGQHPARLNICDCAAYALAKSLEAPLLFKGNDSGQTDVVAAVTAG